MPFEAKRLEVGNGHHVVMHVNQSAAPIRGLPLRLIGSAQPAVG